jgi:hypothetical protein
VIVAYTLFPARHPVPPLGGQLAIPRPVLPVRVFGPSGDFLKDGLLDTGADETIFPLAVAQHIGIDLTGARARGVQLFGRGVVQCRYARVDLRITDGQQETYEWTTLVGFVSFPMLRALLGYADFLQFFDVTFRGADQEVVLFPNGSFPGRIP